MKRINLLIILFMFSVVTACRLDAVKPSIIKPGLVGQWNIVSDSLATGAAIIQTTNYIGVKGDYFNFGTDSILYIKEGTRYAVAAYHIVTDTSVIIEGFNYDYPMIIKPFNFTNATLSPGKTPLLPGGHFYEKIILKK
jgi:hypothetical protein